ncbi:hypothetical protein UA08_08954 [Talaromyces atroroseus]|uniref:BZIP domain-containing protein n=1 Tax=Talaromyces atroroseus TaxID=1441469 RepID=A0A225A7U0_TALAT|nr:hypothetical protein UA08_08954 [Talaromyces atroroseus]OKL55900.1 hypothetical protein UA08_08954 [Talaromyces atroroseus]
MVAMDDLRLLGNLPTLIKGSRDAYASLQDPDNWTGVLDPVERRRRQNRVSQRKFQQRKRQRTQENAVSLTRKWRKIGTLSDGNTSDHAKEMVHQNRVTIAGVEFYCTLAPRRLEQIVRSWRSNSLPISSQQIPPTSDLLLTISKLNVYHGLCENLKALGMNMDWLHPEAISRFSIMAPFPSSANTMPLDLQPTAVQLSIPHHPWLDFFPFPRMRDALILAGDELDEDRLCIDIMGFWICEDEEPALLVWGPPWDFRSWEITETFMKKWGWAVQDSPEILETTNYWRSQRGERRLRLRSLAI